MTSTLEFNNRMPYMPFNWFAHSARVCRLSLAERGLFDAVRTELWTVVDCKMPREVLLARLRINDTAPEFAMLTGLVSLGLLKQDEEGRIFDEVQAHEFAQAVRKGEMNRANGAKGGRPKKAAQPSTADAGGDF
ncbi:hypothetical protein [Methylibium petroleiphilum]|uniref:hypothetical protein n=1 Tax=Methylibium petroleiphilum TaxID=105560 RepID=UPI003D2D0A28